MHDQNNLPQHSGTSPFDSIRRVTAEGREYWSARELMSLLGYEEWRKFAGAIDRARVSASNTGHVPSDHFVGAAKMVETGSNAVRRIDDRHLSRFACYLIAQNGDPRKREIANAQSYFAIQTRQAETAAPAIPDLATPAGVLAMADMFRDTAQKLVAAEQELTRTAAHLETEQRHRKAIEGGDGIDPTTFGKKYFSEVRKSDFEDHLYDHGYLIKQIKTRLCSDGEWRDGYDHRKPTAKGRRFFYTHDTGTYNGRRRFVARVRPQMEIELRDALIAEGLPANEHSTGLVLISNDEIRELGA